MREVRVSGVQSDSKNKDQELIRPVRIDYYTESKSFPDDVPTIDDLGNSSLIIARAHGPRMLA